MTVTRSRLLHPQYRPDIDGLRAIAVLSVVIFHAFPERLQGGFTGVDVFFVISGFLISTIIFKNLDKGTFSFTEFYIRRAKRLFPALIIVLLSCLIVGWFVLLPGELNQLGEHVVGGALFVSNFLLWYESGYFDNAGETKPLLHLWSLGIEEQFYLIWPFMVWLAWKLRLNRLFITVLIALASFYLNLEVVKNDAIAAFYSPQTRFWELLCGAILAWLFLYKAGFSAGFSTDHQIKTGNRDTVTIHPDLSRIIKSIPTNLASLAGCTLLAYGFWQINKELSFPGAWAVIPVLGTVLVISAGEEAWINRRILSSKVFVWFGLLSFPLYLWHWPILSFARIVENDTPSEGVRVAAVVLSIFLAWLTAQFIEKPFRFRPSGAQVKLTVLFSAMLFLAITGEFVGKRDFSRTHGYETLWIKRKGFEHAIGSSLQWYRGRDDWLFLGNAHEKIVEKIKLAIKPTDEQINATFEPFDKLAKTASKYGIKTVLIVGPNKASIYPEYLPRSVMPSASRYLTPFLDRLEKIPGLTIYDPTLELLAAKDSEGLLYWRTDTHWNNKGAFLAFKGFARRFDLPVPDIEFEPASAHHGDLVAISKLRDFPSRPGDNWRVIWKELPKWSEKKISDEQTTTPFGQPSVVTNSNPLSDQYVWVVGDSFVTALRQYFNATFKEVRYVGQWSEKMSLLPQEIEQASRKPDLIIVVRVERGF